MNGYICFFNGRKVEVYADTVMEAKELAIGHFKPRRSQRHMISIVLAEKDGEPVTYSPN